MNDVIVRLIAMPLSVRAFTVPDEQGDSNIYLNEALSDEQLQKSFIHEQNHIQRGDFCKDLPARVIEKAAAKNNGR